MDVRARRPASPSSRRSGAWPAAACLALALCAATLWACGGSGSQSSATVAASPRPSTTASATAPQPSSSPVAAVTLSVYFLRPVVSGKGAKRVAEGPFIAIAHRIVPATRAPARAAVVALLAGPAAREKAIGMTSALPAGTTLRSLVISGGTATVDLAIPGLVTGGSANLEWAQVVYTLTQFPTVKRVAVEAGGQAVTDLGKLMGPQRRSDFEAVTPPIFVETPAPFDVVKSPLHVSGTANVFEATFQARLAATAGGTLAGRTVTATSGSGTRGTFSFSLPVATSSAGDALTVWEVSMEDGSAQHEVTIPLTTAP